MNFVTHCPQCGTRLRFPLDQGKIKVRCQCGHVFVADPDDPDLYKNGSFDIAPKSSGLSAVLHNGLKRFQRGKTETIEWLYRLRYDIQNLPLLPGDEKRKVVLKMGGFFLVTTALVALFYFLL